MVQSSLAATLQVCPSGCTFATIADAVSATADSDIIAIYGGAYTATPPVNITRRVTLWAVTPVTINGLGVWLTVASSNVTMRGTFSLADAGIAVAANATWYQEGPLVIRHTASSAGYDAVGQPFGASSAVLINGGTWVQNGTLAITARTVGVEMSGVSALWDQHGAVEINVPVNGVAGDAHFGVVLGCNRASWNQQAPLTVRVGVGAAVRMGTVGNTLWDQTATVNITVTATSATGPVTAVALAIGSLGTAAVWTQQADTYLRLDASGLGAIAEGVALDANSNRHTWTQTGDLYTTVQAQNSALVRVVRMGQQSSVWTQEGSVTVSGTTRSNGTIHAIVLGAGAWAGNRWDQSGSLTVDVHVCADGSLAPVVPSTGIRGTWRCGTWRSTGSVALTLSAQSCMGAAAGAHPMWFDSRGCNFTLDRAMRTDGGISTVRCDTAPAPSTPILVRGLPWGTPVQGTCPDLVFLPVVDLHWDETLGDNVALGWTRPAVLRAYATSAFAGMVPFLVSSETPLAANATGFVFTGGNVSEPVAIHMVDRNGTLGANGTIALLPASGMLLDEFRQATTFAILPWIESANLSGTPYTALIDTSSSTMVLVPNGSLSFSPLSLYILCEFFAR